MTFSFFNKKFIVCTLLVTACSTFCMEGPADKCWDQEKIEPIEMLPFHLIDMKIMPYLSLRDQAYLLEAVGSSLRFKSFRKGVITNLSDFKEKHLNGYKLIEMIDDLFYYNPLDLENHEDQKKAKELKDEIVKLIEESDLSVEDEDGTAFIKVLEEVRSSGLKRSDFMGEALLSIAEKLVAANAGQEAINKQGLRRSSALILACNLGELEIVRMLIEQGADVNLEDERKITALSESANWGFREQVELLLNAGATIDQISAGLEYEEETALMSAAYWGQKEVVQLLIDAGADPTLKNEEGKTAREGALEQDHTEIAQMLAEYEAKWDAAQAEEPAQKKQRTSKEEE